MTDNTLMPTDAELLQEWDRVSHITDAGKRRLSVMRAVLAKWGAPDPASHPVAATAGMEPVAWTLTKELEKRETTTHGHLWFTDPVNCMWTPLYTASQVQAMLAHFLEKEAPRIDAAGLDAERHCCEHTLYLERERLHAAIAAQKENHD